MTRSLYLFTLIGFSLSSMLFAQEKKDSLGTETVTIVKPYDPSIGDAFKIKAVPVNTENLFVKRIPVTYSIFSFPVASTFVPMKGAAAALPKQPKPKTYSNFARLGVGNFSTVLGELYSDFQIDRNRNFGIHFHSLSSFGDVDNTILDSDRSKTNLDLVYNSRNRDLSYKAVFGYQMEIVNYYGITLTEPLLLQLDPSTDVAQTYHRFNLGGTINPNIPVLQESELMFYYFGDDFSSNEFQIINDSKLGFTVADTDLNLGLHLNFLSGSFDFLDRQGLNGDYSFINLGLASPEISFENGDFEASAGLEVMFANDLENSENDLYVYPKVKLSYALAGGYKLFGEATGGLQQHSFRTLADENPFVASALFIAATDNKLNLKTGINGSIIDGLFFSLFAKYRIEDNKALFAKRDFNSINIGLEAFDYGNSFNVIYDDVNTLSFGLNAEYEFSSKLRLNLSGEYFDYSLDGSSSNPLEIAANLPDYEVALTTNYRPTERWNVRLGLNLVGEREAFGFELPQTPGAVEEVAVKKSLDAYLDANIEVGYQINQRFSVFLRGNNLLDDDYQRWNDFSVQGIQVLGGLSYKFDW